MGLELLPDSLVPERWKGRKSIRPFKDEQEKQKIVVIDECIGGAEWERVRDKLPGIGDSTMVEYPISEQHPGMTDSEIFSRLINEDTMLVTKDAPFHNYVVKMGFQSRFLGEDQVISKPICGVQPKDLGKVHRRVSKSDLFGHSEFRALLLPKSQKKLKNLRTKRRRIRSQFMGDDNIRRVAVALSRREMDPEAVIGFIVQVHAFDGVKALKATEGVIRESYFTSQSQIAAICYAMINVIRLNLNEKPTTIICDSQCFAKGVLSGIEESGDCEPIHRLSRYLMRCFGQLTFTFSKKGQDMKSLRKKLDSRQVVSGYLADIIHRVDKGAQESDSSCEEIECAEFNSV